MKHLFLLCATVLSQTLFAATLASNVKAAWFETVISPEVGTLLAGYGDNDVSEGKYDDLLATGYCGYLTPANLMAAGGYEAQSQRFASRDTLKMVKTAVDAMFDLRSRLFPEDDAGDDRYPDNLNPPVVNVPGMYKGSKWER